MWSIIHYRPNMAFKKHKHQAYLLIRWMVRRCKNPQQTFSHLLLGQYSTDLLCDDKFSVAFSPICGPASSVWSLFTKDEERVFLT